MKIHHHGTPHDMRAHWWHRTWACSVCHRQVTYEPGDVRPAISGYRGVDPDPDHRAPVLMLCGACGSYTNHRRGPVLPRTGEGHPVGRVSGQGLTFVLDGFILSVTNRNWSDSEPGRNDR